MKKQIAHPSRRRRAGFTLIEILLVVVIIGMLAGIAAVGLPRYLRTAKENTAKADIHQIEMQVKAYSLQNKGKYPSSLDVLTQGEEPYLEKLPLDPWGNPYQYAFPGQHKPYKFDVASMGDDGVPSEDDIANWKSDDEKNK